MQMLHTYCYISSRSRQQSARLLKTGGNFKYVIFSFYENLTDIKYFKIKILKDCLKYNRTVRTINLISIFNSKITNLTAPKKCLTLQYPNNIYNKIFSFITV